jgi:hypothetical protein
MVTEMRVDAVVIGGKSEGTYGTDNDVVLGVVTGCTRFRLMDKVRVRVRNGIGENRMTTGKKTTTFSDQSNQSFSAA